MGCDVSDNMKFPNIQESLYFLLLSFQIIVQTLNKFPGIPISHSKMPNPTRPSNITDFAECRKLYAPNLSEVDIKWRVFRDFVFATDKLKQRCGMICTINFERPFERRHRNNFADKIRLYFERFNKLQTKPEIRYEHQDSLGVFKAMNFDAELLKNICEKPKY
jgi:hypothetical protein